MAIYEVIEERASKSIVEDYYTYNFPSNSKYNEPPSLYEVEMDMVEADSVLFSAVSLTVDLVTYNGYSFIGDNTDKVKACKKLFNNFYDFDQVIDNLTWQLIVYGDAYMELVWDESRTRVMELHPLNTPEIVQKYNPNGDILYYLQKVNGKSEKEWIRFEYDDVIYFRRYWIGTQVYSHCPFKSISRSYATKVHSNDYLSSIFNNLPPKLVYFLKNANDKQRKLFIENLYRAKTNPNIDIVAQGEAFDSKMLQVAFDAGLLNVLNYLRQEILMVTRCPPHWVGMLEGANRGIGENVVIPYETNIKKIQHTIASQINRQLMPKIGLNDIEFKWNAISLLDEKTILGNMQMMSSMRFDSDSIIDYAKEHGLKIPEESKIEEIESLPTGSPQIQNDASPSRQRNNPKDNMNSNIDKKGVSAQGKEKLDQKKMM